jgi:RES domain
VIVFRHADARFAFLWESDGQPAARWHGAGEGPVAYLAETADGAWAEFLRHEEISDAEDLEGVTRAVWAVELPEVPTVSPRLPVSTMTGGPDTYGACQSAARRLRAKRASANGQALAGLVAPSAALRTRTPSGFRTAGGLVPGPPRPERVYVLFGPRPDLVGWAACAEGRPRPDLLGRVRPLGS